MKILLMTKLVMLLALPSIFTPIFALEAPKSYVLTGTLNQARNGKVFLRLNMNGRGVVDSAIVVKGKFSFKGMLSDQIVSAMLTMKLSVTAEQLAANPYAAMSGRSFYLSPGNISLEGDRLENAVFSGNKEMLEFTQLEQQLNAITALTTPIYKNYTLVKAMDDFPGKIDTLSNYDRQLEDITKRYQQTESNFLRQHPASLLSMAIIREKTQNVDPELAEELQALVASLTPALRNRADMLAISKRLRLQARLTIGKPALDFSIPDTLGNTVSLSSYRGKYVLVEFWASWCGPCRAQTPDLLKSYDNYKDKGFDILGISLDDSKQKWISAIHEDKLPWTQVSELKGFKSDIVAKYGINGIPMNFLVDPNGNIVASNLRDGALSLKLAELIKPADRSFVLTGKLEKISNGKIYLMQRATLMEISKEPNALLKDSAIVHNGAFTFKGTLKADVLPVYLATHRPATKEERAEDPFAGHAYRYFYLMPGETKVAGNELNEAKFSGNEQVQAFSRLDSMLRPGEEMIVQLLRRRDKIAVDPTLSLTMRKDAVMKNMLQADSLTRLQRKTEIAFILQHPAAILNLALINERDKLADIEQAKEIGLMVESLSPELRNRADMVAVAKRMKQLASVVIGGTAPDFSMPDRTGKQVSLSSFRGKYVLVEFWASWCGPCRAQIPHLLKSYTSFKNKNFEILGVSLDENREKWLKAVKDEKLPWPQICDLKALKSDVVSMYGITGIPLNFLLDPKGIIIAKDLRDEQLSELLNKKL